MRQKSATVQNYSARIPKRKGHHKIRTNNKPAQPGAPSTTQLAARIKYNGCDTVQMMNATSERSSPTMRNKQGSFASVSKPHLGDQILIGKRNFRRRIPQRANIHDRRGD